MGQNEDKASRAQQNEGEGSRSAARRYNEGVKKTIESGQVEEKAHEAQEATEGPEGTELRRAEEEAKRRGEQAGSSKK